MYKTDACMHWWKNNPTGELLMLYHTWIIIRAKLMNPGGTDEQNPKKRD